ncbi:MAG: hypothetical protein ACI976_001298 [Aureispira sp.]|jgi:hypothetical protein
MQSLISTILIFLSISSYAQDNACHCLNTSIEIHNGGRVFDFVVDSIYTDARGQQTYLYKEEIFQRLKAIATLQLPPQNSLPKVKELKLNAVGIKGFRLGAHWDFDLKKADKKLDFFAKTHGGYPDPEKLNAFNFLKKMNSPVRMKLTILPTASDLSAKQLAAETMTVELKIHPHPLYSNRNIQSPFKRSLPYLKLSLAYLEGQTWHIEVDKHMRIRQKLSPLRK